MAKLHPLVSELVFAACAPGLEPVLAAELQALGLDARPVPGGAEAAGEDAVALACIGSRVADAVSARLYSGPDRGAAPALEEARRRFGRGALAVRRAGGQTTVSLDAVGEPLFKRGWRARMGAAPLRESLAAGMLLAAGYDGEVPLLDPMCGSGTLALEAAAIAARRAPGVGRRFAFEGWPDHDARRTAAVRARLAGQEREPPCPIHASDRNAGVLRAAQKNAAASGLERFVRLGRADAAAVEPPPGRGLLAVNPPYGVRLDEELERAWRALGALLGRLPDWSAVVLAPGQGLERLLPRPPMRTARVRNGGLACRLLLF
jgi:putative N6-adenine-specific DNA methylase